MRRRARTSLNSKTAPAKLARAAAEHYVKEQAWLPLPPALPAELNRQKACYILILQKPGEHMRALIGEPLPRHRTLAEEIIHNVTQAVMTQVRRNDLPYLTYRVAVLEQLQRITAPEHLAPDRFGLYVRSDRGKSALVLPRRIGIETPNDQIATALREAGITPRHEALTMYRVLVTYYE